MRSRLLCGFVVLGLLAAACGGDSSTATTVAVPVETTATTIASDSTLDPIDPQVLSYDWEAGEYLTYDSESRYRLVETSSVDGEVLAEWGLAEQALDLVAGWRLAYGFLEPDGSLHEVVEVVSGYVWQARGTRGGEHFDPQTYILVGDDPVAAVWSIDSRGNHPLARITWPRFLWPITLDSGFIEYLHSIDDPFGPPLPAGEVSAGDTWSGVLTRGTSGTGIPREVAFQGRVVGAAVVDGVPVVVLETTSSTEAMTIRAVAVTYEISPVALASTTWFDPESGTALRKETRAIVEISARFTEDGPESLVSRYEYSVEHVLVQREPYAEFGHGIGGSELLDMAADCVRGDDVACDVAFSVATAEGFVSHIGGLCGGRYGEEYFCSGYDQITSEADECSDEPFLEALSGFCEDGVDEACHALLVHAPPGSVCSRSAM